MKYIDKSIDEWFRLDDMLMPYNEPLRVRPLDAHFTAEETNFVNAYVFWTGVICEGDIFGMMDDAIVIKPYLEAVGMTGSLSAIDKLLPLYLEYQQTERPGEYLNDNMTVIKSIERLAESREVYALKLLQYAQLHLQYLTIDDSPPAANTP